MACRIVESVGALVKHVKMGDKCIPVWQAECTKCEKCKSPRTNICDTFMFNWGSGLMPSDKKTTRFTRVEDGKPIYHFFGISVFSQYTVVDEACVAKINPRADLTKVCLLGCGIPTGNLSICRSIDLSIYSLIFRYYACKKKRKIECHAI